MSTPTITLYKAGFCPYCVAASRFLREVKGVELTEIDLTGDHDGRLALVKRAGGKRTVPQIWIGETHVGGYDELRALDRAGGLDPLLAGD
jgi:glutaredoxin 3